MMYVLLAVGGTGNKILESMVWAAACDALYTGQGETRVPISTLHILSVDVDAGCGNTTRAMQVCARYEEVRALMAKQPFDHRGFHTELRLRQWNMDLTRRGTTVKDTTDNHRKDQLLAGALFSRQEASLAYSEGFRGHPDLGVLFFSDLLSHLDENAEQGKADEMMSLLRDMEQALYSGEKVKVMLCGSIFGGTGASGIPMLSRFLRDRFSETRELLEMGAVLMLPYYHVPAAVADENEEIVVRSDDFPDKARAALQYYGMEGLIRQGLADERGLYDAVFLLGLPENYFVSTGNYSTGSQSQRNDAHLLEWLASRCIARFDRTDYRADNGAAINCYYYQIEGTKFRWDSFDDEAALYRRAYGGLMKCALAWTAEFGPALKKHFADKKHMRDRKTGWYAAYFHRVHRMNADGHETLNRELAAVEETLTGFARWMGEVVTNLPPQLRHTQELEKAADESRENYRALVDATVMAALLREKAEASATDAIVRGDADNDGLQGVSEALTRREQEIAARTAAQSELDKRTGGRTKLDMMTTLEGYFAGQSAEAEKQEAAALRELDRLQQLPKGRVSTDDLKEAQERVSRVTLRRSRLARSLAKVRDDLQVAALGNLADQLPEFPMEQSALPRNDLFEPNVLQRLSELVKKTLEGLEPNHADVCAAEKLLHRFVLLPADDPVTMERLYALLGSGAGEKRGSDPLAAFLMQLMNSVMWEAEA